jgi:hypothetical protein
MPASQTESCIGRAGPPVQIVATGAEHRTRAHPLSDRADLRHAQTLLPVARRAVAELRQERRSPPPCILGPQPSPGRDDAAMTPGVCPDPLF